MYVKAVADVAFRQTKRGESTYKIKKRKVTLIRGRNVIASQELNSQNSTLGMFAERARSGDRIVVDMKQKNFVDIIEDVNFSFEIFA